MYNKNIMIGQNLLPRRLLQLTARLSTMNINSRQNHMDSASFISYLYDTVRIP